MILHILVGRKLEDYTVKEVGILLDFYSLGEYKAIFDEKGITGKRLFYCHRVEDLSSHGVTNADALLLLEQINLLKQNSG